MKLRVHDQRFIDMDRSPRELEYFRIRWTNPDQIRCVKSIRLTDAISRQPGVFEMIHSIRYRGAERADTMSAIDRFLLFTW